MVRCPPGTDRAHVLARHQTGFIAPTTQRPCADRRTQVFCTMPPHSRHPCRDRRRSGGRGQSVIDTSTIQEGPDSCGSSASLAADRRVLPATARRHPRARWSVYCVESTLLPGGAVRVRHGRRDNRIRLTSSRDRAPRRLVWSRRRMGATTRHRFGSGSWPAWSRAPDGVWRAGFADDGVTQRNGAPPRALKGAPVQSSGRPRSSAARSTSDETRCARTAAMGDARDTGRTLAMVETATRLRCQRTH